jgi:hypothetical protein
MADPRAQGQQKESVSRYHTGLLPDSGRRPVYFCAERLDCERDFFFIFPFLP